jgi:NAD(P)-dependent dehydrogenase (short-subunit alcohol dehydrogenase family)
MKDLAGRVAFITGGGSGIGFGIAKCAAEAGMKVAIADVRADHLEQGLAKLRAGGAHVHGMLVDVADAAAVERAAEETIKVFGKVHLVCNNAGVSIFGPMDAATTDDWRWIMGVNVDGAINGIQSFMPRLKAHGEGGHIVNTASMAGLLVGPGMGLYSASKFAVVGLTLSLRYDLAPHGIGVSVLCPGFVRSNIHEAVLSRPKNLSATGYPVTEADMKRLDGVLSVGMDPVEVGAHVIAGVRENRQYIFPHAEFREELKAVHEELLAALPNREPEPARMAVEDFRRQRKADAAKLVKNF